MLDTIDREILSILQSQARTSNADVARAVGLVPSATLERIRKLEKMGVIRGYETLLDPRAVGAGLLAFVFVRTNECVGQACTGDELAKIPEVLEVHHVAGEDCYLAKVRAASTEVLGKLLREKFGAISTVVSTRTTIVLETLKESGRLPLEGADAARDV